MIHEGSLARAPTRLLVDDGDRALVVVGEFQNLYHRVPALRPLYPCAVENAFDAAPYTQLARDWWWVPFAAVAAYLALVAAGRAFMASRFPLDLRRPLIAWNALLAVYSLYGAARTLPHLVVTVWLDGALHSVCANAELSYGMGPSGLAVMLFSVVSKIAELGDTAFLVLRKKPVTFIHWYHHASVLVFTWVSYAEESAAGLWFCAVNYGVHALMYYYYALSAAGVRGALRPPAVLVTGIQLAQMVMGVLLHAVMLWQRRVGRPCAITDRCLLSGLVIYGSYLFLFARFAVGRYMKSKTA